MKKRVKKQIKTFFLLGVVPALCSCAAINPLKPVDYASGAGDFQMLVSNIIAQNTAYRFEQVSGKTIGIGLRGKIKSAVIRTDKTFRPGFVYQTTITHGGSTYTLFLMDTVIAQTQTLTTEGGSQTSAPVGLKACSWVLYLMSPR
jgi:hypothetical protein